MNAITQGLIAGVVFGALTVASMLPMKFPDKRAALLGAFLNRFAIGLLIAVVGGSVLVAQPRWLVGRVPPPETNDIRYASATLVLIEAIGQVRAYATAKGQLPSLPSEAGVTNPAVTLKPLQGGEFELRMQVGDFRIAVRSTDALKPLIVSAVQSLMRRAG